MALNLSRVQLTLKKRLSKIYILIVSACVWMETERYLRCGIPTSNVRQWLITSGHTRSMLRLRRFRKKLSPITTSTYGHMLSATARDLCGIGLNMNSLSTFLIWARKENRKIFWPSVLRFQLKTLKESLHSWVRLWNQNVYGISKQSGGTLVRILSP
jgi:hypothetical protein